MTTAPVHTAQPDGTPGQNGAAATRLRSNVEVIIPTFNEEANLPFALKSVCDWADRVHVVDSGSTDGTRAIAEQFGVNLVTRSWLGYAKQKNWALDNLPIESDWVFILDADESITAPLRDEIIGITTRPTADIPHAGFYVNRLTYFMGKAIRHCGFFPSYNLRLFRRGKARYEEREVHEHMVVDGPTRRLRFLMGHEDRRGLEHFIAKHNRYSTLEARELVRGRNRDDGTTPRRLETGIAFRRWLKYHVMPRLPLAGLWRFLYMYVLRVGFLDGATGFRFCLFLSSYDFFISLKLNELKRLVAQLGPKALEVEPAKGLAVPEGIVQVMPSATDQLRGAAPGTTPTRAAPVDTPGAPVASPAPRVRVDPARPTARPAAGDDRRTFVGADAATSPHPPVSIVVLTYNEEDNIGPCLESCAWCDDVHVLDSGSADRTRDIAQKMGAGVHVNKFKSFGQQRNFAIDSIPTRHRWQFHLDADERFTPALVRELDELIRDGASGGGVSAYRCPSMMMFMDEWLRHAAEYPVYQVRLFDKVRCRFEDHGHGQREVTSDPIGTLRRPYLHYNFSKGVEEWFEKHNRYSTLEARQAMERQRVGLGEALSDIFRGDALRRRRRIKSMTYSLPARSLLIFLYTTVFRMGFLDGRAGLNYARLRSLYEGMIAVKLSVLRHERSKKSRADHAASPGSTP